MRIEFPWEWPDDVQSWLHHSIQDIAHLEGEPFGSASNPSVPPSAAV